jgi:hypothetical protein
MQRMPWPYCAGTNDQKSSKTLCRLPLLSITFAQVQRQQICAWCAVEIFPVRSSVFCENGRTA